MEKKILARKPTSPLILSRMEIFSKEEKGALENQKELRDLENLNFSSNLLEKIKILQAENDALKRKKNEQLQNDIQTPKNSEKWQSSFSYNEIELEYYPSFYVRHISQNINNIKNNLHKEIKQTIQYIYKTLKNEIEQPKIQIAGCFNDWKPQNLTFTKRENYLASKLYHFEISLSLQLGEKYYFKFIVDNKWVVDDRYPFETVDSITNNVLYL